MHDRDEVRGTGRVISRCKGCGASWCRSCGCCEDCCDCDDALFDADELGEDPEED